MLGLDAVGQTMCLYKLKLHEAVKSTLFIGFNVKIEERKNLSFIVGTPVNHGQVRLCRDGARHASDTIDGNSSG